MAIAALEEHVLSPEYFHEERYTLPLPGTWKSNPIATQYAPAEGPAVADKGESLAGRTSPAPDRTDTDDIGNTPPPTTSNISVSSSNIRLRKIPGSVLSASLLKVPPRAFRYEISLVKPPKLDTRPKFLQHVESLLKQYPGREGIQKCAEVVIDTMRNSSNVDKAERATDTLIQACKAVGDRAHTIKAYERYVPLLREVLLRVPGNRELYEDLHAPEAALECLTIAKHKSEDEKAIEEALKAAVDIFCYNCSVSTLSTRPVIQKLARNLPGVLYWAGMWKETVQVCKRVEKLKLAAVKSNTAAYGIMADHKLEDYGRVLYRYYNKYAEATTYFQDVVVMALDSSLRLRTVDSSENVLKRAAKLAEESNGAHKVKVEWAMRLLTFQWSTTRNLGETKILFDRLLRLSSVIDRPAELYYAIGQYCIEAGEDETALQYLIRLSTDLDIDPGLKGRGNLALGAAMKGDWDAVGAFLRSFLKEARLHLRLQDGEADTFRNTLSKLFPPIFKLYARAHDVQETKSYLRSLLHEGLKLHPYASNVMIHKFAEAQDMDSIDRWLEFVRPMGIQADSATFNSILTSLRDEARLPFNDLYALVKKTTAQASSFPDSVTYSILRESALRMTKGRPIAFSRRMADIKRLGLLGESEKNHEDYMMAMRYQLAHGNYRQVLTTYHDLVTEHRSHVTPELLAMAVQACLNISSDQARDTAIVLLSEGKKNGIDIGQGLARLLIWEAEDPSLENHDYKSVLRQNAALCHEHGFRMPMSLINHISTILMNRGNNLRARAFWQYWVAKNKVSREDLTMADLNVLARMQFLEHNMKGIEAVMETLSLNKIMPDTKFYQNLVRERQFAKREMYKGVPAIAKDQYFAFLDSCLHTVKRQRAALRERSQAAGAKLLQIVGDAADAETALPVQQQREFKSRRPLSLNSKLKDIVNESFDDIDRGLDDGPLDSPSPPVITEESVRSQVPAKVGYYNG